MRTTHQDDSCWGCNSTRNFVMLKPHANIDKVNAEVKEIVKRHTAPQHTGTTFLYPVSKMRLYSNFKNGKQAGGKTATVRVFLLVAIFILLIACINFMNMSTARSEKRA